MLGLAKIAAEYANREDDLIERIENAGAKMHSLESSVHPAITSEMNQTKGVHALAGTGIGGLAGAALGGALTHDGFGAVLGGLYGGVTGLAIGAVTGSVKADSILLQRDPHLYHEIQKAKTEEYLAHAALENHHELKSIYSQPQKHDVYHHQGY